MMTDDFVEDNILTRSDVHDLLRWKSVCKSWYSLISNSYFVKAHLKHHKTCTRINNNDIGQSRIAMPRRWKKHNDDNQDLYQHNLVGWKPDDDEKYHEWKLVGWKPNDDEGPGKYQSNRWDIVGSSNGLVCVSYIRVEEKEVNDQILLINPRTREVRELPMPTIPPNGIHDISLSFGYDSSTDDYKLLAGINKVGEDGSLVQVFSLKSMTWKLISHTNYLFIFGISGVLVNGAFHWFAHDFSIKKVIILSFDLSREEFKAIPKPDDSRCVPVFSTLGIFQDNLCMSCEDENEFYYGNWVMRNYNSWEFLPNDYEIKSPDAIYYMNMYDCTSPTKQRTGLFCDDTPCFSRSLKHIISKPIYVQSLVSPYLNTQRPSHTWSAKIAERECEQMHMFESARNNKCYKGSEEKSREIMDIDKLGGRENEKSYLREDINKKKSRDVNMSKGKRHIVEILAKDEGESSKRKREE